MGKLTEQQKQEVEEIINEKLRYLAYTNWEEFCKIFPGYAHLDNPNKVGAPGDYEKKSYFETEGF